MFWYVLYVKSNAERKVARELSQRNIEVYAPVVTEIRQWSDRKKKIETPLFKSYVFVRLESKDRNLVFDVPGAVRYLYWLNKPAVVRDKEIDVIRDWLTNENIDTFQLAKYNPGDEITINRGLLKNRDAVIQEVGKKTMKLFLKDMGVVVTARLNDVLE